MSSLGILNTNSVEFKTGGTTDVKIVGTDNTLTISGTSTSTDVNLTTTSVSGNTGGILITPGASAGANGNGGSVTITGGSKDGSGIDGVININSSLNLGGLPTNSTYNAPLSWKTRVRAATTAAGTLASSFENSDTIDGVTLATGDRILIKNQADSTENGIYIVNASGAPTRASDAKASTSAFGAIVYVMLGTSNVNTTWVCTTNLSFGAAITFSAYTVTAAAASPANSIQYNSAGSLAGSSNLTYNGTDTITFNSTTATLNMSSSAGTSTIANAGTGLMSITSAGAMTVTGADASAFNLATTTTTGAINIGIAATTGVITIGSSATGDTINIDTDAAGTVNFNGTLEATSYTAASVVFDGGIGIAKNIKLNSATTISNSSAGTITLSSLGATTINSTSADLSLTTTTSGKIVVDAANQSGTGTINGTIVLIDSQTFTDNTAAGDIAFISIAQQTLDGTSTATSASTLYITGAPNGTKTVTNKWALNVSAGNTRLGGNLTVTGSISGGAASPDNSIQYNSGSNTFAGSADLTFSGTTLALGASTASGTMSIGTTGTAILNLATTTNGVGTLNISNGGNGASTINLGSTGTGTLNIATGSNGVGVINLAGGSGTTTIANAGTGLMLITSAGAVTMTGAAASAFNLATNSTGTITIGTSSSTLNIGSTSGTTNLGTSGTGTLNIATSGTSAINMGTTSTITSAGTMTITGAAASAFNLATNSTGTISIGNGTNSGTSIINLSTDNDTASTINIGGSLVTVNLNGTDDATSATSAAVIVDGGIAVAKSIWLSNVGSVIIGSTTPRLSLSYDQGGTSSAITSAAATSFTINGSAGSIFNLATTNTTGAINIGIAITSGIITIGNGANSGTQTITLATSNDSASTINIGSAQTTLNLNGTTNATSSTVAAVIVDGGIYIAKDILLSNTSTITNTGGNISIDAANQTASGSTTGTLLTIQSQIFTDSGTANMAFTSIAQPTLDGSGTTANASTLYITNAPGTSGGRVITNAWALNVAAGNTRLGGNLTVTGSISGGAASPDNSIQYNSGSNTFAGSADLTFSGTTLALGASTASGTMSIGTTGTAILNLATTTNGVGTLNISNGGNGASTINLGSTGTGTLNIATGSNGVGVINLAGGSGTTTIANAGTGLMSITSAGAMTITGAIGSAFNLATTNTTGAINIGIAATTGVITIGSSATGDTINIDTDSTGTVNFNGTKEATNATTASVVFDGGIGIAKKVYCAALGSGSGNALAITTSNQIVDSTSLRALKSNETLVKDELTYNINNILKLEPKFFNWKEDNTRDFGFVVEDAIDNDIKEFLFIDPIKGPRNYKDRSMIAGIIAYLKRLDEGLEYRFKEINQKLDSLESRISNYESKI